MQLFEAFWGAGGSLQPYKRIVRPVAEWHAAAAEVRGLSTAVWGRRKGFVATTAGTGRKRQQGLWHYDMQLQRRFEAVPGSKQLLLGHAAAAEVRGRSGGQTAGTGTGRNRQEGLWHYGMQCSGGLKPFRGANGSSGTVEKDLLRPRQALALEGTAARPVALWHAAAAEVRSLSGGQTAGLEP